MGRLEGGSLRGWVTQRVGRLEGGLPRSGACNSIDVDLCVTV